MINIKILGMGCANCKRLEQMARDVVNTLGIQAEVEKVTDFEAIMKYPILSTPGFVVNEQVVSYGRIPTKGEIESWLKQAVS